MAFFFLAVVLVSVSMKQELLTRIWEDKCILHYLLPLFTYSDVCEALPKSAQWLWNLALQSNERGDFFPVWGTCLGFEFLVQLVGGKECLQFGFNAENVTLPLLFPSEEEEQKSGGIYSRKSHLYPTDSIRDILSSQNITMNNHHRGITPIQFLNNSNLTHAFKITSTNFDLNGRQFVSTIESNKYPIYGIQWHPEKNNFEYGLQPGSIYPFEAINHSEAAVDISIQLSKFFVSKARNSTIGQYTMFSKHPLISTYPVISGYSFEQVYKIPPLSTASFNEKEDEEEFISRTKRLRGNKIISTIR